MRARVACACVVVLLPLTACTSDRAPAPWALNNGPANAATNNAATNNATTSNNGVSNNTTPEECEGSGFECAMGCGGDYFMSSECVNGRWRCPTENGPWIPIDDCPPGSCFGLPYPGEICDDGFKCRPDVAGYGSCDGTICLVCDGFDPALHNTPECACECTPDGTVICAPPPSCEVTTSSDLPGVELRLRGDTCAWSRDVLAAGVSIGWDVTVDPTVAPAMTTGTPQDAGQCGQPDATGLMVFWDIRSDEDDRYCECDTGLCFPNMLQAPLAAGSGSFEWFGNNWLGPSDTGNPMGLPFNATEATVRVSAVGMTPSGDAFELTSEMQVQILD